MAGYNYLSKLGIKEAKHESGICHESVRIPLQIHPYYHKRKLKIRCVSTSRNAMHGFVITTEGSIYCQGKNFNGQCAIGAKYPESNSKKLNRVIRTPRKVTYFSDHGLEISSICCYVTVSAFMTTKGDVYLSGGYDGNPCDLPQKMEFPAKIIKMKPGYKGIQFLTQYGAVWCFTFDFDRYHRAKPKCYRLDCFVNRGIRIIDFGNHYGFFLDSKHQCHKLTDAADDFVLWKEMHKSLEKGERIVRVYDDVVETSNGRVFPANRYLHGPQSVYWDDPSSLKFLEDAVDPMKMPWKMDGDYVELVPLMHDDHNFRALYVVR